MWSQLYTYALVFATLPALNVSAVRGTNATLCKEECRLAAASWRDNEVVSHLNSQRNTHSFIEIPLYLASSLTRWHCCS